jgi:predicted lipoprotein with Yx(FWY)xxD motif
MKRQYMVLTGIVAVLIIVGVGYAVLHKSNKPNSPTYSTSSSSSNQSETSTVNNTVLKTKSNSSVGTYLTDTNGNALYTYGSDTSGVSNCTGACLANWPAYQDKSASGVMPTNVGTITRADNGEKQYTYKGLPLYTFTGDSQGQVTGNGVANFKVAKP